MFAAKSADYDGWAQMGARGWSWDDVLPYFKKSENQQRGANEAHGTGGPLSVSDFPEQHPVSAAIVEACRTGRRALQGTISTTATRKAPASSR